jgi:hypothetical protein
MTNAGIFIYGTVVFAFVATALGLIAWGIVTERRARLALERRQGISDREGEVQLG